MLRKGFATTTGIHPHAGNNEPHVQQVLAEQTEPEQQKQACQRRPTDGRAHVVIEAAGQ